MMINATSVGVYHHKRQLYDIIEEFMHILRLSNLEESLKKKSCFLFGVRQSGKSSYIKYQLKEHVAKSYNLLEQDLYLKLSIDPTLIRQELEAENITNALIVVDEIQKCPQLLDEIHLLIEKRKIRFLLTGSSIRKLKAAGTNMLAGRARTRYFHPFVYMELKDTVGFDLEKAMQFGLIPSHYLSDSSEEDVYSYVARYLTEEISQEGLTRNIPAFARFLEVAATCNAQLINYTSIASDAKVSRQTVQNYFEILKDTLIGYELDPFVKTVKRKAIETKKFYFFDMGVVNCLRRLGPIAKGSKDYGDFFEHFIFMELKAYIDYAHPLKRLFYWRSTSDFEVDFLIENKLAIEVKNSDNITDKHLKGLLALKEENLIEQYILISQEKTKRKTKDILIYPWKQFLEDLWNGKLI